MEAWVRQRRRIRTGKDECPICSYPLYRVHRRLLERVLSLIYPVRRYRCSNRVCRWEGALRVHKQKSRTIRDRRPKANPKKWWALALVLLSGIAIAIIVLASSDL